MHQARWWARGTRPSEVKRRTHRGERAHRLEHVRAAKPLTQHIFRNERSQVIQYAEFERASQNGSCPHPSSGTYGSTAVHTIAHAPGYGRASPAFQVPGLLCGCRKRISISSNTATLFVIANPSFSNSRMLASFFSPILATSRSFGTGSGDGESGDVAYESISCSAVRASPLLLNAGSIHMG